MGFPSDFIKHPTIGEQYKQIGNAVPPPLAGAVARHVRALMDAWFGSALTVPHIVADVTERGKVVGGI